MNFKNIYYPESRISGFTDVDGTIAFYSHVNGLIKPGSIVLDIGCGRGAYQGDPIPFRKNLRVLKGKCEKIIGIDIDLNAAENPFLNEFRQITSSTWPIENESIDLCICDYVLEHIADPGNFFIQIDRILKPGGIVCIRTSNILSYVGLFSKTSWPGSHLQILRKVKENLSESDIFPTFYKCNTVRKIQKQFDRLNFNHTVFGYEAEPGYLAFSRFAYFLGVLHQRHAPSLFKVGIHAFGVKPFLPISGDLTNK